MSAPDPTRSAGDPRTRTQPPDDRTAPFAVDPSLPTDTAPEPVPGYELLGPLGEGGVGVVYQARQTALGRVVALKMLLRGATAGPAAAARFLAEAEAVPAVDHPHVVRVHDFAAAGGRPYLAMEFCPGGTLADRLKASGGLQPAVEAARLLEKIARGVAAAHAAGVVHRDVKPANVLFDAAGEPKVADFGLAKRDGGSDLTRTAAVMGTPHYMAPEQADGRAKFAGPPADVWALGAVLYECLTGTRPFDAAEPVAILHRVRHDDPPRPRSLAPTTPRDLELICLKCLEKNPADRYPTAAELAADLGRFLAGEPIRVRPAGPAERLTKWARRKPTLAAAYALAGLAVVLGSLVGLAGWQWHRADSANGQLAGEKAAVEAARDAEQAAKEKLAAVEYGRTVELAYQAWQDNQVSVAQKLLAGTSEHLRGWEYGYVHRLCHPAHMTFTVSGGRERVTIWSVKFTPDGRYLVTGGPGDGTTRVWDATSGKELHALKGRSHHAPAAFSRNGRQVVTTESDRTLRVWDAGTGTELRNLKIKSEGEAAISPDGRRLATFNHMDGSAQVWDAADGRELLTFECYKEFAWSIVFSPDGRRLLTASRRHARMWDAATGAELLTFEGHTGNVFSVAASPDGGRAATASADHTARVWDAATGKVLLVLRGHEDNVRSVVFSADGKWVLTGSEDGTARVWDAADGREILTIKGHAAPVMSAAFSPDGRQVATAGRGATVYVWAVAAESGAAEPEDRSRRPIPLAYSPDGQRLLMSRWDVGTEADIVQVCDAASGKGLLTLKGRAPSVLRAAFSPDGRRVAMGGDGEVRVWDAATGTELRTVNHPAAARVEVVGYGPDGRLVTGASDGTVRVWDADGGKELLVLRGHTGTVYTTTFSPDGQRVVTSCDGAVRVWDAATGTELRTIKDAAYTHMMAWYAPDGRLVTAGLDGTVRVLDGDGGKEQLVLRGHADIVYTVAFSPDGRRLVTIGQDRIARVWDMTTGTEVFALRRVALAAFSPDGRRLMTAYADGTVRVLDSAPDRREVRPRETAPVPRAVGAIQR